MEIEIIISTAILFLFTFTWKAYDYLKACYQDRNIYKKVGWIAEKDNHNICYDSSVSLRNEELISHVIKAQNKLMIPKEFCINYSNETEKNNVEEILNLHKTDVVKSFFHGFLSKSKDICKLNSSEYYFYSLYNFFYKQLEKSSCISDKLYQFKDSKGSYSYYELTDYGRAYYKLYLIATLFSIYNEKTKKLFKYISPDSKNRITNLLEKNEVAFWSYSP